MEKRSCSRILAQVYTGCVSITARLREPLLTRASAGDSRGRFVRLLRLRMGSCVQKVSTGCMRSSSPAVLEDLYSRCAADSVCKVVLQGIARQRLREGRGLPRSASIAEAED